MAPKIAGSKNFSAKRVGKGVGKAQVAPDPKRLFAVDPSHAAAKWSIRPYLDKRGSPFFGDITSNAFLSEKHMLENVISGGSSEWCNRLGFALSLGGSTIQGGAKFVDQYCAPKDGESAADTAARAFKSFGLADLARILAEPDGAAYVRAMTFLNDDGDNDRSEKQVAAEVKRVLRFLRKDADTKAACYRRIVNMAAKLYVFGMELLAETYLVADVAAWQDKVRSTKVAQPPGVQRWLRSDPDEWSKVVDALVDSYTSQKLQKHGGEDGALSEDDVVQPRDRKRRRRGASESDLGSDGSPPHNRRRGRGRSDSLASHDGRRRRRHSLSASPAAPHRAGRASRGRPGHNADLRQEMDLASDSDAAAPTRGWHSRAAPAAPAAESTRQKISAAAAAAQMPVQKEFDMDPSDSDIDADSVLLHMSLPDAREAAKDLLKLKQALGSKKGAVKVDQVNNLLGKIPADVLAHGALANMPAKFATVVRLPKQAVMVTLFGDIHKLLDEVIAAQNEALGGTATPDPAAESDALKQDDGEAKADETYKDEKAEAGKDENAEAGMDEKAEADHEAAQRDGA